MRRDHQWVVTRTNTEWPAPVCSPEMRESFPPAATAGESGSGGRGLPRRGTAGTGLHGLTTGIVVLTYLTLGTYAVPELRITIRGEEFPYIVPLSVLLLALGLVRALQCRERTSRQDLGVLLACAVYCLATIASLEVSAIPNGPLAVKYVVMASFPVVLYLCHLTSSDWTKAVWMLGATSLAVLIFGAYGYLTGEVGDAIEHGFGYFGVTYTTSTRNSDALYFLTLFAISFALARKKTGAIRVAGYGVALGAGTAIIMSLSRGAWMATAAGLCGVFYLARRNRSPRRLDARMMTALLLVLVLSIGAWFVPEEMTEVVARRLQTIFNTSDEEGNSNPARIAILSGTTDVILDSAGLGVGVGNLRLFLPAKAGWYVNHAENTYLQVLAEQGFVGFLAFCALGLYVTRRLIAMYRRSPGDWVTEALLFWVIALLVFKLFNNVLDSSWYWAVVGLAVAYAAARDRELRQTAPAPAYARRNESSQRRQRWPWSAAGQPHTGPDAPLIAARKSGWCPGLLP